MHTINQADRVTRAAYAYTQAVRVPVTCYRTTGGTFTVAPTFGGDLVADLCSVIAAAYPLTGLSGQWWLGAGGRTLHIEFDGRAPHGISATITAELPWRSLPGHVWQPGHTPESVTVHELYLLASHLNNTPAAA